MSLSRHRPSGMRSNPRRPIVLSLKESEVLDRALQAVIEQTPPGGDDLALLYTLLRKNNNVLRKLQDTEDSEDEFD